VSTVSYQMIRTYAKLREAIQEAGPRCALDFETTSLSPKDGRVRIVSLCSPTVQALVDFDSIKGGFKHCAPLFYASLIKGERERTEWYVFNASFELSWFLAAGVSPIIRDVENLRRAVLGGSKLSLARMAKADLNIDVDKEEQRSDWSVKDLRQEQLDYAYGDADVTWRLADYWLQKMDPAQITCAYMFDQMVPAVIEMEEVGMLLDKSAHRDLTGKWQRLQDQKEAAIREIVPKEDVPNINSQHQWNDYLTNTVLVGQEALFNSWPRTEKTGMLQTTSEVLTTIAAHVREDWQMLSVLLDTLAEYKKLQKYTSSFGEALIAKAGLTKGGRIHARFNIAAARTCRFSSSGPNLQQIPRNQRSFFGMSDMSIRRSFIAPRNRVLVSLDYSGIELRVLALLSGDEQLLYDVTHGDLHSEVASFGAGRPIDKSNPDDKVLRDAAKSVSFGIIYGSGATGLAAGMKSTISKAQGYIDFWASRYEQAFQLRHDMYDEAKATKFLRMVDGGTIYLKQPDLPKCANYPVQRAALSIMARAIIRHKARLDEERKLKGYRGQPVMLSTIHDALIDEVATSHAKYTLRGMEEDMTLAYLDIFPNAPTDRLVEGGIGPNWGDLA
jgi:DNA polymerase I